MFTVRGVVHVRAMRASARYRHNRDWLVVAAHAAALFEELRAGSLEKGRARLYSLHQAFSCRSRALRQRERFGRTRTGGVESRENTGMLEFPRPVEGSLAGFALRVHIGAGLDQKPDGANILSVGRNRQHQGCHAAVVSL